VRNLIENARGPGAEPARELARGKADVLAERYALLAMQIVDRPPCGILAKAIAENVM